MRIVNRKHDRVEIPRCANNQKTREQYEEMQKDFALDSKELDDYFRYEGYYEVEDNYCADFSNGY